MNKLNIVKYPSITRADSKKIEYYVRDLRLDQVPWQVGLKVHGSNFQMATNGGLNILCGKKTGPIGPEDGDFYNYKSVVKMYQQRIIELYKFLKRIYTFDIMTLNGEIFGGVYGHPDVPRSPDAIKVQKGVHYCPHNDFFLFDIKLDNIFINKVNVDLSCRDFGFIGNQPLWQGSFRECLEYPNEFQDPLHKEWNLPEIEGNICEGIVIEPEEPRFFNNGKRVILKSKNDKFSEKEKHKKMKVVTIHDWSPEGNIELNEMMTYVVEPRLRNILSHMGDITDRDFGKILGSLTKDVFSDYLEDRSEKFESLDKEEQKLFKKEMSECCKKLLKDNFLDILDNEF